MCTYAIAKTLNSICFRLLNISQNFKCINLNHNNFEFTNYWRKPISLRPKHIFFALNFKKN